MSEVWLYSIISVLLVSAVSLVGVFALGLKQNFIKSILFYLVSFSAGALLGDVFLHIFPEMAEAGFGVREGWYFIAGILIFFVLERWILWHHSHREHDEKIHSVAYLTMAGDTLHNFVDGIVIAASFLVSKEIGIASTIAVILHEIPQEIGQYAILVHGGWSRAKALGYNLLSGLAAVVGALIVLLFAQGLEEPPTYLIAFAGASFIYIALSDLVPELHEEVGIKRSIIQFIWFIFGIGLMSLLLLLE